MAGPAALAWQQALAGQIPNGPEVRNFPPIEGAPDHQNMARAILSGLLLMPQTAVGGYKMGMNKLFGPPATPAVSSTASPLPDQITPPTGPGIPAIPTRTMTGGGPQQISLPAGPELRAPPMLPEPPQMNTGGAANYSKVRELADQAKPGPIDQESLDKAHWAAVLGGAAGGAASVDATMPGSFAAALGKAGAGASKGSETSATRSFEANTRKNERTEDFFTKRASLEKDITTAQQAQAQHANEIAFRNAELKYKTLIANQNAQYEYMSKKDAQLTPVVKHDANGISIQQLDPQTRQLNYRFIPTKPMFDQMEKMESVFKGLNIDSDAAKAANIAMLAQNYAADPIAGAQVFKRLAVNDIIKNGAGSTVFGADFDKVAKEAKTELDATTGATLAGKPEAYLSALNDRISSRLLGLPMINQNGWVVRGASHSPYARVLIPGQAPRNNPNAQPAPQIVD